MGRNNNLLLGIILGAALGVAFAPKKGSELRKELSKDLKEGGHGENVIRENAVVMGKDIAQTAQEVYSDPKVQAQLKKGKKEATKLFQAARQNLEENGGEWVEVAREKLNEAKEAVGKTGSDLVKKIKKQSTPVSKPASKKGK